VLAQQIGDTAQDPRALLRQLRAPFRETAPRGGHRRVYIRIACDADAAQRFAGARVQGVGVPAGKRFMPVAAVMEAAVLGKRESHR